jgi:AraC-like DNA-binding protein
MLVTRTPTAALRPFVKALWASEETLGAGSSGPARELVLPTGLMHLAIRISGPPLRVFGDAERKAAEVVGHAVVGGARAGAYVRDLAVPVRSVGAQLYPGVSRFLFGASADELAGRHTLLDDLWGRAVMEARERLMEAASAERQLDVFESLLAARLPRVRGLHPAVAEALERFTTTTDVNEVVEHTGYSHRRFIMLFREAVGLTPKLHCRVQRFQSALDRASRQANASWVDVALAAGYCDQAHFNREFREFAGLTPGRYRELAPIWTNHVPLPT